MPEALMRHTFEAMPLLGDSNLDGGRKCREPSVTCANAASIRSSALIEDLGDPGD